MNRLMTATAFATLIGTSAMALTDVEASTIESFLPRVKVETLTDTQVTTLLNIANSGDSVSEKGAQMRSIVAEANLAPRDPATVEPYTGLTDTQRAEIKQYAPELDIDSLNEDEIQVLQTAIYGGDVDEINTVVSEIKAN